MSVKAVSSREFQQNANQAQKAAVDGPVFITNRGRPVHVLLSYEDYQKLTGGRRSIVDALAMPELGDIEFETPRSREVARPADLD